jgi:hypothetical protein
MSALGVKRKAFQLLGIGIIGAAVAVLSIVLLTATAKGGETHLELAGVSSKELKDSRGIDLFVPAEDSAPQISKERAETTGAESQVSSSDSSVKAREVVLARLVNNEVKPPIDRLVWVVNLDPSTVKIEQIGGGPIQGTAIATPDSPLVLQYSLAIIDAKTGELLYNISTATQDGPPPPTPLPDGADAQ